MPKIDQNNEPIIKIKCEKIYLLSSSYCQEAADTNKGYAKLDFSIDVDLYDDHYTSKLNVHANYLNSSGEANKFGQSLSFCIAGVFTTNEMPKKEVLINFAKLYSLSILWPYAREYASDVFRRTGYSYPVFPIVNPQGLTKQLIKNKKITINDLSVSSLKE